MNVAIKFPETIAVFETLDRQRLKAITLSVNANVLATKKLGEFLFKKNS